MHPEVRRRGSRYPEAAVRSCFGTVFAALVIRTAYGPGFATAESVDDDQFVAELGETAVRFLLADPVDGRSVG